jgi:hypothetical protein
MTQFATRSRLSSFDVQPDWRLKHLMDDAREDRRQLFDIGLRQRELDWQISQVGWRVELGLFLLVLMSAVQLILTAARG